MRQNPPDGPEFEGRPNEFPPRTKTAISRRILFGSMEGGKGARASLAKAAAALTMLSLLPAALSGSAPSLASIALPNLLPLAADPTAPADNVPWSTSLFGAFSYDGGEVSGTYVRFAYNQSTGTVRSVLNLAGETPVMYIRSIQIDGFSPSREGISTSGPLFHSQGFFVTFTAHDDPTILLEVRSKTFRTAIIELPPLAENISLQAAPGTWPASSVSFTVGGGRGRFFLGVGSMQVYGNIIRADMADQDLLLFKSVPSHATNRFLWDTVLDAIQDGQLGAELALVATPDGQWVQNGVRFRNDVDAWPLTVQPGKATIRADSTNPRPVVILLAFDTLTMPAGDPPRVTVHANGTSVNRTDDSVMVFDPVATMRQNASYALLPFPGTVVALYLPSLSSVFVDVASIPVGPQAPVFDRGSEFGMIAALAIVSVAAAHMLRRRES